MHCLRDIELVFPIKDAPSASLMRMKADRLHKAGVIDEAERQWVNYKARTYLDDTTLDNVALIEAAPVPSTLVD